jgi:hypothetical protein
MNVKPNFIGPILASKFCEILKSISSLEIALQGTKINSSTLDTKIKKFGCQKKTPQNKFFKV